MGHTSESHFSLLFCIQSSRNSWQMDPEPGGFLPPAPGQPWTGPLPLLSGSWHCCLCVFLTLPCLLWSHSDLECSHLQLPSAPSGPSEGNTLPQVNLPHCPTLTLPTCAMEPQQKTPSFLRLHPFPALLYSLSPDTTGFAGATNICDLIYDIRSGLHCAPSWVPRVLNGSGTQEALH